MIVRISADDVVLADQQLLEPRTAVLTLWSWPFRLNRELTGEVISYVERRLYVGRKPYIHDEHLGGNQGQHRQAYLGILPHNGIHPIVRFIHFIRSSVHSFVRGSDKTEEAFHYPRISLPVRLAELVSKASDSLATGKANRNRARQMALEPDG